MLSYVNGYGPPFRRAAMPVCRILVQAYVVTAWTMSMRRNMIESLHVQGCGVSGL